MVQDAALPKTAEGYAQLGDRFRKRAQPAAACKAYYTATKMDRECTSAYVNWGELLLRKAKHRAALDKFFRAIKIDPDSVDYSKWVSALDNLSSREQVKATQAFEQFMRANPSKVLGFAGWAQALCARERYSAADEKFGKGVELDPKNAPVFFLWADSLSSRGKFAEAVNKYLEAARIDAIRFDYADWIKVINGLRSDERAKPEAELQEIVEQSKAVSAYDDWARALVAAERYEDACDKYRCAARLDSQDVTILERWADVLVNLGRYEDACDKYRNAARLDSQNVVILKMWGDALLGAKRYQEALSRYQLAISLLAQAASAGRKVRISRSGLPYYSWVVALEGVDKYQREAAIEQFRKIVDDSNYAAAYRYWGDALARRKGYQNASEQYQAAAELNPQDALTYQHWGVALEKLGDRENAFEKFRLASQRNPARSSRYSELLIERKEYSKAVKVSVGAMKVGTAFPDLKLWIKALDQCPVAERAGVTGDLWQFASTSSVKSEFGKFYFDWGEALAADKEYEPAISQYRRALELDPDLDVAQIECANALADSGEVEEAMRMYLSALERHPEMVDLEKLVDALDKLNKDEADLNSNRISEIAGDDPEYASIFRNLGVTLDGRKRNKEAIVMYENALQLDCEDLDSYYFWGLSLFDVKKYRESIEKFQQVINFDPRNSNAYDSWGYSLLVLRDYSGAIEKFEQAFAVATEPLERVYAYKHLGSALAALKDYEGSLEKYRLAAEFSSDKADAFFTWGNILGDAKRHDEAREKYRMAIEANPESIDATYSAHNISDSFFGEGRYAEGRVEWGKALLAYAKTKQKAIDDKNAEYFQYYGGVLQSIFGRLAAAQEIYREGLKLDPDHVGILTAMVSLCLEKKDEPVSNDGPSPYWEARKFYQRAQNILLTQFKESDDAKTGVLLGQLILTLGEYMTQDEMTRAEDYLLKALANDANADDALTHLGVLFTRKKEFTKAIQFFTDAFKLKPDDLNVWSNLAEAYLKAATTDNADPGLKEKAETEFKKILEAAPNHVESIIGLGEVYKAMGDVAKDEDLYARAIEQFDCGIRIADSAAGSKKLKKRDCAAAQYSAGYAKVKLYEVASTAKDESLLSDALAYFKSAVTNDPANFKAKRAAERIEKRRQRYASQRVLEKFGPPVITSGAGVIFLLTQIVFLTQHPVAIGAAAYASLSFGALLFTVAGLSLPQLLKLKVAGIELEKSAVEQITTAGALGIGK